MQAICDTPAPPADWTRRDFDDHTWIRVPGNHPPYSGRRWGVISRMKLTNPGREFSPPCLARILMRGKFIVTDPSTVKSLKVSVDYRGGAIVTMNGKKIAGGHLPPGAETTPDALAEDYPEEVYLRADGSALGPFPPWSTKDREAGNVQRWLDRIRHLKEVPVPTDVLVKGTNVLAVEIRRAPYRELMLKLASGADMYRRGDILWGTCGFHGVKLAAEGVGVVPNVRRPKGLQMWNGDPLTPDNPTDYGDPAEPLRPVVLVGAPGGKFSGKVVLGSDAAVHNLHVVMGPLVHVKGKDAIGPTSVCVRRALPPAFDALTDAFPSEIPEWEVKRYRPQKGETPLISLGVVQPIWVTVAVPTRAVPGEYRGTLTILVRGENPVRVPVRLTLAGWKLPPPRRFQTVVDFMQSPESVALYYDVPLYGERHFRLMENAFKLLGEVGNWTVYIPLVAETNQGNEQTMVRWVRRPDGGYACDFRVMERYLDLATRHMGKPRIVCLRVWDYFLSSDYRKKKPAPPVPVSGLDPVTGTVSRIELPPYGTPEHKKLWQVLADGIRERLAGRGLEKAMVLGPCPDGVPSRDVVKTLNDVFPGVPWMGHSHGHKQNVRGAPIDLQFLVYTPPVPVDPLAERTYGWQPPNKIGQFCRTRADYPLSISRLLGEMCIQGRSRGFGRVGLDFWRVLKDKRGRRVGHIHARYPKSQWSNLDKEAMAFLPPGPKGAMPTARLLMMREGLQECEARIFIERALTDDVLRKKLSDGLVRRCDVLLADRTRGVMMSFENHCACGFCRPTWAWSGWQRWFNQRAYVTGYVSYIGSGWQKRSAELFDTAAEVARAVGTKRPMK
ncbi:MAG: hypothetical protein AMS16_06310 [Planctomycetes bacterium DG_58]|nr:MAG: hypothetical protein AMS16_06310 [Planctomycetes bacterium DG_58]